MQLLSENLKREITGILGKYDIAGDDRSFIIEKIESGLNETAQAIDQAILAERAAVTQKVDGLQQNAMGAVSEVTNRAKAAVKKAFKMGLAQGVEQAKPPGMSIFQIGIMTGILALAVVVVYREFFAKKEKD